MKIFDYFPTNYKGYCVEAGAYDGIFLSQTITLESLGWNCLCIEPNPKVYPRLIKNRKLCLPYALSDKNEPNVRFEVYYSDASGYAGMSSFHPSDEMIASFSYTEEPEIFYVTAKTLDDCLNEVKFPKVDYVCLDIEGWELTALKGFSLEYWKPTLLQIENIFASLELRDYLKDKGYTFIEMYGHDDIYIRNSDAR